MTSRVDILKNKYKLQYKYILPILCILYKSSVNVKILKEGFNKNQNTVNYLHLATIPAIIGMQLSFSPNLDLRRAVN